MREYSCFSVRRPSSPTGVIIELVHEKQAYTISDALQHAEFGLFQKSLVVIAGIGAFCIGARLGILAQGVSSNNNIFALEHTYASLMGLLLGTFLWKYIGGRIGRKPYLFLSILVTLVAASLTSIHSISTSFAVFVGLTGTLYIPFSLVKEFSPFTKHHACLTCMSILTVIGFSVHCILLWIFNDRQQVRVPFLLFRFVTSGTNLVSFLSIAPLFVTLCVMPLMPESIEYLYENERFDQLEELLKEIISFNDRPTMQGRLKDLLEERMVGISMPAISVTDTDTDKTITLQQAGKVERIEHCTKSQPISHHISIPLAINAIEACLLYGTLITGPMLVSKNSMTVLSLLNLLLVTLIDIPASFLANPIQQIFTFQQQITKSVFVTASSSCLFLMAICSAYSQEWILVPLLILARTFASISRTLQFKKTCEQVEVLMIGLIFAIIITLVCESAIIAALVSYAIASASIVSMSLTLMQEKTQDTDSLKLAPNKYIRRPSVDKINRMETLLALYNKQAQKVDENFLCVPT
jgi:hypothetical protein